MILLEVHGASQFPMVLYFGTIGMLALTIGLGWPHVSLLDFLPGLVVIGPVSQVGKRIV